MNEYMYILTKTMMDGRVIPVCVTPFKDVAIYKAFDDMLEHEWIESNEDAIYCLDSYTKYGYMAIIQKVEYVY